MGQIQKVFNRYEKKFLLDEKTYNEFKKELDEYMSEDDYGLHTIRNIYYDTPTDELIRTSIEGPMFRSSIIVTPAHSMAGQTYRLNPYLSNCA